MEFDYSVHSPSPRRESWTFQLAGLDDYGLTGFPSDAEFPIEEEFRDASEVLANRSLRDLQNPLADLEISGINTYLKIPRTDSMSSSGSENISADSFFQRGSSKIDDLGLGEASPVYNRKLENNSRTWGKKEADDDGSDRSTLTKEDISKSAHRKIPDSRSVNSRVTGEKSGFSKRRSSAGSVCTVSSMNTLTALEELDRICRDFESDEEEKHDKEQSPHSQRESFGSIVSEDQRKKILENVTKTSIFPTSSSSRKYENESNLFLPLRASPKRFSTDKEKVVDDIRKNLRDIEENTKEIFRKDLDSTMEIYRRDAIITNKLNQRGTANVVLNFPGMVSKQETFLPSVTEESFDKEADLLRRAEELFARMQRKEKRPLSSDKITAKYPKQKETQVPVQPVLQAPFQKISYPDKIPRRFVSDEINNFTAPEPKSFAQPFGHQNFVNHFTQTDFELSQSDKSVDSLLEQSTYPYSTSVTENRHVTLATRQIFFPPTEINESSTAKLQIKNYSTVPYQLVFSDIPSPFRKRYESLYIQPRRYVNLPIRFSPLTTGYFHTEFIITVNPSGEQLKVDIIGEGIPNPRRTTCSLPFS